MFILFKNKITLLLRGEKNIAGGGEKVICIFFPPDFRLHIHNIIQRLNKRIIPTKKKTAGLWSPLFRFENDMFCGVNHRSN